MQEQGSDSDVALAWLYKTPAQTNRAIEIWIAAPPAARLDAVLFDRVVDESLGWLLPHAEDDAIIEGACSYRLTPRGRAFLADEWVTGAAHLLTMRGRHLAWWSLMCQSDIDPVVEVNLRLLLTDGEVGDKELLRIVAWVQQFVVSIGAAVAFVFDDPFVRNNIFFDDYSRHIHDSKITSRLPRLDHWWAVRRYTRGPAWGTYLGPDLCVRMGGQAHVIRAAPVWHAEAVGEGAWLQLAPTAPCAPATADPLIAFLAPLYDWDAYNIEYDRWHATQSSTDRVNRTNAPAGLPLGVMVPDIRGATLPIRILPDAEIVAGWENSGNGRRHIVVGVNLHSAGAMTSEERDTLREVIRAWFAAIHGPPNPHDLFATKISEPDISSYAARFVYGGDRLNHLPGIEKLRDHLAALPAPQIVEIVLGQETVG